MTPAEQLAHLPEPVQAELWQVARVAAGMSREEKRDSLAVVTPLLESLLAAGGYVVADLVALLSSASQVIAVIDQEAYPREAEVIRSGYPS